MDFSLSYSFWISIVSNSDLKSYPEKWHNQNHHIVIKVPPLGVTFIKGKELNIDTIEIDSNNKVSIGGKSKKGRKVSSKAKTKEL